MSAPTPPPAQSRGTALTRAFHEEEKLGKGQDLVLLARLWPFLKPHAIPLFFALGLMPLTTLASLAQPYLVGRAVNAAIVIRTESALFQVAGLYLATAVAEFVFRFAQVYYMQLAGQKTVADLRRATFAHVQTLRVGYFDRTPIGRVVTRITNDADALGEIFASGAVTAIADIIMLVGIVAAMLYIDWHLSLFAFAALPPLAVAVEFFRRFAREAFRSIRAKTAQLNAFLSEQVQGVAVVQAFSREAQCAAEYERVNADYRDANYKSIKYDALLYSVVESVAAASVAMVLWYASVQAKLVDGAGSAIYVGTVVAFYEYIHRFFIPIRDLSTKYTIVQASLAAAERIFGLLDVRELDAPALSAEQGAKIATEGALAAKEHGETAISFRDVSFAYRAGTPVLRHVSFSIRKGEKVAIVGATGSGKTTVTALLQRLYEIDEGHILVEGKDVRLWEREALRARFAAVPQDVFLFAGTVLENVAVGDPNPDRARATLALERASASEHIAKRGEGLDARVTERGSNFSAGERQLIAFARALYRDPSFLILDEATANIDSETESRLQRAAAEVIEGRTAIIIAHRLSTVRHADRILVFHHGEIVEEGSHDALVTKNGVYARLYRLQFEGKEAAA